MSTLSTKEIVKKNHARKENQHLSLSRGHQNTGMLYGFCRYKMILNVRNTTQEVVYANPACQQRVGSVNWSDVNWNSFSSLPFCATFKYCDIINIYLGEITIFWCMSSRYSSHLKTGNLRFPETIFFQHFGHRKPAIWEFRKSMRQIFQIFKKWILWTHCSRDDAHTSKNSELRHASWHDILTCNFPPIS